jgi:hypothetical protein
MLGNNKDYKTADKRARTQLAKHAKLMEDLMAKGMDRNTASAQALNLLENRQRNRRAK